MGDIPDGGLNMDMEDLKAIGSAVYLEAEERFEVCGAGSDFGIQNVSEDNYSSTVFGGTNRVLYSPRLGWRPDRPYCTERFLREWDAHYGN